eukprot:UN25373
MFLSGRDEMVKVTGGSRVVNVISKVQIHPKSQKMRAVRRLSPGEDVWVSTDGKYRLVQVEGKKWRASTLGSENDKDQKTEEFEFLSHDTVKDEIELQSLETKKRYKVTTRNLQSLDKETGACTVQVGTWASRNRETCRLQCLASVRNPTQESWSNIDLTLVAGGIQFIGDFSYNPTAAAIPAANQRGVQSNIASNIVMQQAAFGGDMYRSCHVHNEGQWVVVKSEMD